MQATGGRAGPILQALFVTFLWSTSWVLIKIGLRDIPALTFAGLRYVLAFGMLLPVVLGPRGSRQAVGALPRRGWLRLALLGVTLYTLTQGAQYLGLAHLPAAGLGLALSFTPALVALAGIPLLGERPRRPQWVGMAIYLAGVLAYLGPLGAHAPDRPGAGAAVATVGVAAALVGLASNAGASLLGREVNRRGDLPPRVVTAVSMGVGSLLLLACGVAVEGLPRLDARGWAIVAWLAAVNTAFAFTLWNRALRRLSAFESSLINNTMLFQIAILAWIFLGEALSAREIAGLLIAGLGLLLVQLPQRTAR